MQVPAYWPVVEGVQLEEKRGVVWEVKKVACIIVLEVDEEEEEEWSDDMSMM